MNQLVNHFFIVIRELRDTELNSSLLLAIIVCAFE